MKGSQQTLIQNRMRHEQVTTNAVHTSMIENMDGVHSY